MKKYILVAVSIMALFSACVKKVDIVDGNYASVTLVNAGTNYVTDNITVNSKDSIFFSFTITSDKEMGFVGVQKNPVNQTAFLIRDTMNSTNRHSYTAVKKFRADSTNGSYIYRIAAHDTAGVYIGHKDIIITVKTDFDYFVARPLQVPDTTAKINTCYMATKTGTSYSYTTGASKSADIDFGFYYDTTGTLTTTTADDVKFSVYALSSPQPQLSYYDISTWTKNVTIMKKATSPAFNTLTSAAALRSAGIANLASGASGKATLLATNSLVYFKTAAGKYGCMFILSMNTFPNGAAKENSMVVEIKVER
jgi:hypothetical protein